MQIAAEAAKFQSLPSAMLSEFSAIVRPSRLSRCKVIRCSGAVVSYEPSEIPVVATKMILADNGMQGAVSVDLQLQSIDDWIGKAPGQGCRTGCAPKWDPSNGPIG